MKTALKIILVTSMLLAVGLAECNAAKQTDPPSIYYRTVKPEETQELTLRLASYSKSHPLSSEDATRVRELVSSQTLQSCGLDADKDREKQLKIRRIGRGALPLLAEMMTDSDAKLRLRAFGMAFMFLLWRDDIRTLSVDDYKETDRLLTLLALRSLMDKDSEIRAGAILGLASIGRERRKDIPDGVQFGLQYAESSDPDPKLRELAHQMNIELGFAPRDPGKHYSVE